MDSTSSRGVCITCAKRACVTQEAWMRVTYSVGYADIITRNDACDDRNADQNSQCSRTVFGEVALVLSGSRENASVGEYLVATRI